MNPVDPTDDEWQLAERPPRIRLDLRRLAGPAGQRPTRRGERRRLNLGPGLLPLTVPKVRRRLAATNRPWLAPQLVTLAPTASSQSRRAHYQRREQQVLEY